MCVSELSEKQETVEDGTIASQKIGQGVTVHSSSMICPR